MIVVNDSHLISLLGLLIAALAGSVGVIYRGMRADIKEIKTDIKGFLVSQAQCREELPGKYLQVAAFAKFREEFRADFQKLMEERREDWRDLWETFNNHAHDPGTGKPLRGKLEGVVRMGKPSV